jgi:predicted amidohydrolase
VHNEMKVALAQLSPALRNTAENVRTVREVLAEHGDADLVVFPELFLSSYTVNGLDELALDLDGPEVESVAQAARENSATVIFGAPERIAAGIANSAICVDQSGDVVGSYRKTHLFGDERTAFVAGDELLIVDIDGLKVGLMICFDVEFPEVARALARAGAELLVTISANMEPFGNDHAVFASARALENGLPHAYVNQVGPGEKGLNFTGGSTIVSPDGEVHAQADAVGETVLNAGLSLPMKSNVREDYLSQLRFPMPEVRNVPSGTRPEARA